MSHYGYPDGGNGANGRGRTSYQSWGNIQDGAKEYPHMPKRPGTFDREEQNRDHVCKPVIISADGRVISGVSPFSCPPNVKCNVQDYTNGVIPSHVNGGRKAGFPQGMFQRRNSGGWNAPTYVGDGYAGDWNEESAGNTRWGQPREDGWRAAQGYPGQNDWGDREGYPGTTGRGYPGQITQLMSPGAIDSREAAKRYNGRFIR